MRTPDKNCHLVWNKWLHSKKFRATLAAMAKKHHKSYRIRQQTIHRLQALADTSEVLGDGDIIDLSVAVLHNLMESPDRAAEIARTAKSVILGLSDLYGVKQIERTSQRILPLNKPKI